MHSKNEVELSFDARSVNEGFARMAVAAFITELNPTMDELSDVKTAVSEAVTNAIIHGYDNPEEKVHMTCRIMGREVEIIVCDTGRVLILNLLKSLLMLKKNVLLKLLVI